MIWVAPERTEAKLIWLGGQCTDARHHCCAYAVRVASVHGASKAREVVQQNFLHRTDVLGRKSDRSHVDEG